MKKTIINNSNFEAIGYDSENSILEIEFKDGRILQYVPVPSDVYNKFIQAFSLNSFYKQYISKGNYAYSQVR